MLFSVAVFTLGTLLHPSVTRFSGHLAHAPAGDSVRLTVGFRPVSAALSPRGDFRFDLKDLRGSTPTQFSYGGQQTQLSLAPGDQLVMQVNFADFDKTLVYSGRGSLVNNYLAKSLYQFAYGPPGPLLRPSDFPKGTPVEARAAAEALRQARRAYLADYGRAHPLPPAFVHEEQVHIDADWAIQQLGYAYQHDNEVMPAGYFGFIAEAPVPELDRLRTRSIVDNSALANFVLGYGARLVPTGQLSADPAEGPRLYQLATKELGAGRARDWAMEALLFKNLRGNLPGAQAFYRTFRQYNPDSALARTVRKSLVNQVRMQPGQPAPAFTLRDNTGKTVSLSDFKGQIVYLDFWGTWCAPCLRQLTEFAPALKKQFEGRAVVFLYVSVGDAEAKWQQVLSDKHFIGKASVHLRSPDNLLADVYQVDGYPSYYLIGRDGRLLQAYAPAPSAGAATVAAIEAALKN